MDPDRGPEMIAVDVLHRTDDADVVDRAAGFGEQVRNFDAALAIALEPPVRPLVEAFGTGRLAMILREVRLRVEAVDVRDAAGHKEENHALRLRREVWRFWRERIFRLAGQQFRKNAGEQKTAPRERSNGLSANHRFSPRTRTGCCRAWHVCNWPTPSPRVGSPPRPCAPTGGG